MVALLAGSADVDVDDVAQRPVLAGRAAYTIGQETGMIAAGDVILIPAGLVHSFEAQEDIDAIAVLPAGAQTFAPDGSLMAQRV